MVHPLVFSTVMLWVLGNLRQVSGERNSGHERVSETIGHMLAGIADVMTSKPVADRPFVTLSFAQSLDSKIGIYLDDAMTETSSNYALSGPESLVLTHGLRSIHDGILVGGRTLSIDNPRLSNRLWTSDGESPMKQPRPVVLDTKLHHVFELVDDGSMRAKDVIVCCSQEARDMHEEKLLEKSPNLVLLSCKTNAEGQIDLLAMLQKLKKEFRIDSLMVEGGSAIISSFLRMGIADCLCVTIAPKIIGSFGLPAINTARFGYGASEVVFRITGCEVIGDDIIILALNQDS
mmetsp:Transcript_1241/g.3254  ORF Transcript_1241/g.3254 Transcript_1241/m.3254 type:complete len:290 (-) Transcript_1241:62-931(-)